MIKKIIFLLMMMSVISCIKSDIDELQKATYQLEAVTVTLSIDTYMGETSEQRARPNAKELCRSIKKLCSDLNSKDARLYRDAETAQDIDKALNGCKQFSQIQCGEDKNPS